MALSSTALVSDMSLAQQLVRVLAQQRLSSTLTVETLDMVPELGVFFSKPGGLVL